MEHSPITTEEQDRLEACSVAVESADGVLSKLAEPHQFRPTHDSQAESEAQEALDHGLESTLMPFCWRVIVEYSCAATEHAGALGTLLRAGHPVTAPAVARCTIENAQRATWLLEPAHEGARTREARVTARQRAARAQLEELYSDRHRRDTLEKLAKGAPPGTPVREAHKDAVSDLKQRRLWLPQVFGPGTVVEGRPEEWVIEQQELPVLTGTSEWFFKTMTLGSGTGIYDMLAGWSHPTLWGIRDHLRAELTMDGGIEVEWSISVGFAEKLSATTCSTLYRMLVQAAGYFGWDESVVHAWAADLNRWTPDLIVG
jgi:hypothetical protein